jgi:hypothetical protein
MMKNPAVVLELETIRSAARHEAVYDIQEAVKEIDKAVLFAYAQKNAMAIAKLLESKGKLFGLYVERVQIETVDLKGALHEARTRVFSIETLQRDASVTKVLTAGPAPFNRRPALDD